METSGEESAMNADFPLFPIRASTIAASVDTLFLSMFGLEVFILILIFCAILYFCIKYHFHTVTDRSRRNFSQSSIEITWTLVPLVLLIILFFWSGRIYLKMYTPPKNSMEIFVLGKQWMWKFLQPNGRREAAELHVPLGIPIKLTMTSEDVIHSLFVPAFRIKQDVLPGRYTSVWFQASVAGEYHLFCTQYCGTQHAEMGAAKIIVMKPEKYEQWLSSGDTAGNSFSKVVSLTSEGRDLFQKLSCNTCHFDNVGIRAPRLEGLYGSIVTLEGGKNIIADDTYIRESILEPNVKIVQGFLPVMPSYKNLVNEEQLLALTAYIKSMQFSEGHSRKLLLGIPAKESP